MRVVFPNPICVFEVPPILFCSMEISHRISILGWATFSGSAKINIIVIIQRRWAGKRIIPIGSVFIIIHVCYFVDVGSHRGAIWFIIDIVTITVIGFRTIFIRIKTFVGSCWLLVFVRWVVQWIRVVRWISRCWRNKRCSCERVFIFCLETAFNVTKISVILSYIPINKVSFTLVPTIITHIIAFASWLVVRITTSIIILSVGVRTTIFSSIIGIRWVWVGWRSKRAHLRFDEIISLDIEGRWAVERVVHGYVSLFEIVIIS